MEKEARESLNCRKYDGKVRGNVAVQRKVTIYLQELVLVSMGAPPQCPDVVLVARQVQYGVHCPSHPTIHHPVLWNTMAPVRGARVELTRGRRDGLTSDGQMMKYRCNVSCCGSGGANNSGSFCFYRVSHWSVPSLVKADRHDGQHST